MQISRDAKSQNTAPAADYVTTKQVAKAFPFWDVGFWPRLRVRGGGPRFYVVGRRVLYRLPDVEDWIAAHAAHSTADGKKHRRAA